MRAQCRYWLIAHREKNCVETEPTVPEGTRLKELEREVQELMTEAQLLEKRWLKYRGGVEEESRNRFTISKKLSPSSGAVVLRVSGFGGAGKSALARELNRVVYGVAVRLRRRAAARSAH